MFAGSEETFIILQNTLLTGITDVSFDYSVQEEAVLLLANRGINRKINKPHVANCSITKKYLGRDFLNELTGFVGLSGQFIYGQDALDFTDAAISRYQIKMNATEPPEVNVDLKIYGDLKPTTSLRKSTAQQDEEVRSMDIDFISLNFMGKNSPVTEFNFSADFDCKPTYEIESAKSSAVKIFTPVKYAASAKIEMTEQEYEDMTGLFSTENFDKSFSLIFDDRKAIETIQAEQERFLSYTGSGLETGLYPDLDFSTGLGRLDDYSFGSFGLSSQNISISPKDTIQLSVNYNGYSTSLPEGVARSSPTGISISDTLESLTSGVDAAIEEFLQYINTPKSTGENFETLETGNYPSASGHFFPFINVYYPQIVNFESQSIGATNDNLHALGVGAIEDISDYDVHDFESTPIGDFNISDLDHYINFEYFDFESTATGVTSGNLFEVSLLYYNNITNFESTNIGATNENLHLLG